MRLWILVFVTFSNSNGQLRDAEYECGNHGHFEYCIDGVPGCVIGCHCHPGFYFDTDTKICEPNIRLTKNFRREYDVIEPTRVHIAPTPPTFEEPLPSKKTAVDEKIDMITKDADDLGDWLYNQFFKAIENQVINETKDDSVLTRRSGIGPSLIEKPTRRSKKSWKSKKKKKKRRKNLKNKLLRITEDDSLFDSSDSSSASDETSGSSSASSSSESHDHRHRPKDHKPNNNDHGHKKIVVFNKRPKPPLPSFIFLPNMETPFYPPIGLPPPPMQMYPMVPVPPVIGGPFPFPPPMPSWTPTTEVTTRHSSTATSSTIVVTKTAATIKARKPESKENLPKENYTEETNIETENTDFTPESQLRNFGKKRHSSKTKLAQKLRDKVMRQNKLQKYLAQAYQDSEMQMMSPPILTNSRDFRPNMLTGQKPSQINVEDEDDAIQDVDFKYLSQLIHRSDTNKTNYDSPGSLIPISALPVKQSDVLPSRRSNVDHITEDHFNQNGHQINSNRRNYNIMSQPLHDTYERKFTIPNQISPYIQNQQLQQSNQNPIRYNLMNQITYNSPRRFGNNNLNEDPYNIMPGSILYGAPIRQNITSPIGREMQADSGFNDNYQKLQNMPRFWHHHANNDYNRPSNNVPNKSNTYQNSLRPISHRNIIQDTNDSYYSNLGRQIAFMIRNIDEDKDVDIEIKASSNIPSNVPVLSGTSGSRSYWERYVRSPFNIMINSFNNKINKLRSSNEDLFTLENKVSNLRKSSMTLNELENVISKMHVAKSKLTDNVNKLDISPESSKISFNVNLLQGTVHDLQPTNENIETAYGSMKIQNKRSKPISVYLKSNKTVIPYNPNNINRLNSVAQIPDKSYGSLLNSYMFTIRDSNGRAPETTAITKVEIPTRKTVIKLPQQIYKMPNPFPYTNPIKGPFLQNINPGGQYYVTTKRPIYQQLSPMFINHKKLRANGGRINDQYLFQNVAMAVKPSLARVGSIDPHQTYGHRVQPSYFHHEVHHLDYFNDFL